jgi:hypothetical protein
VESQPVPARAMQARVRTRRARETVLMGCSSGVWMW